MAHFLSGSDVFVSFPKCSGKSLCYCLLPLAFDILRGTSSCYRRQSKAIIMSPLVSLMIDQMRHMTVRNVHAVYVENYEVEATVCKGVYQLGFLSPEALLTNDMCRDILLSPVYQENLVAVFIDKTHCVKKL